MNRYSYILPIFQMAGFYAIKLNFILKGIKYQKKAYICTRKPNVKQRLPGRLMGSVCLDDPKVNK